MTATYGGEVTARYAFDEQPPTGHPLLPGASPRDIRANLLPEDREKFDGAYEQGLVEARESLDLSELFKTLEHWRQVAWMTSTPGPDAHRRMVAKAEHILRTGELPPGTVPWSQVKTELGLQ